MKYHIAIIGGGITGLTIAYYLQQAIERDHLPIRYTLVESSHRWGGQIDTVRRDGFVIERGPDSFLERKKYATQLCHDLGLADQLVHNQVGQSYIYHDQQLRPIPKGSVMGIPTNFEAFLETELLTTKGKARVLEELMLKPKRKKEDQSVGEFFRDRFGEEMVERILEPLVAGVYGSSIDDLSLEATYPEYQKLLLRHGSLIRAFRKTNRQLLGSKGIFQTLRNGLLTMVEQIVEKLPSKALMTNQELKKLVKTADGYGLIFHNGQRMVAQSIILTTPYRVTRKILQPYIDVMPLERSEPTSAATIALAYAKKDITIPYEGTGFIVPKGSSLNLTACTWVQKKWPHTTPKGKALLRCFVGRPSDDRIVDASDEEITKVVLQDLQRINGIQIKNDPEFVVIHRMKKVRPLYGVGHIQWVRRLFDQLETRLPRVYLAGSSYQGIGLPDCIRQGREVVDKMIDSFFVRRMVVRS